jgi:predicted O-methyltransferase YrrM
MTAGVPDQLMNLAGGDPFVDVRRESEMHQRRHGCGLHNAGGPQMQLVAAIARAAAPRRVLDLGSGLGYSTLWLASALAPGGEVVGIDSDSEHVVEATRIAAERGHAERIRYIAGYVAGVLPALDGTFDVIHDDAWFAKTPDHLDAMVDRLRPGGLLTMANWFLLVDALTGEPRNSWETFAGPDWAADTLEYARELASRSDLDIVWITQPPIAFATKRR